MATRVIHVITRLIVGGAQENTILSCRGLKEAGYDVSLITGPETGAEGTLIDKARAACPVIVCDSLRRDPSPLRDGSALLALTTHFLKTKPHIVHTHSSKAGILGRVAAWMARVPIIIHTNHGLPFHEFQSRPANWAWKILEMGASLVTDRLVCVGATARMESINARLAPAAKHVVVYSGMEVDKFVADGTPPSGPPTFGAIGRFSAQKSPGDFVEVAKRIVDAIPGARGTWVGDGPLRKEMEQRVSQAGLGGKITFAGLVAPDRVPELLRSMDVVILTSLWEGLPRVAVQAALAGRPVVAYGATGMGEAVIDGQTGFVVAPRDIQALSRRAIDLLSRPDRGRSMGGEGRTLLAGRFDWRQMVRSLDNLYREALGRHARKSGGSLNGIFAL